MEKTESKFFILDLPRFATVNGTCRINGILVEYRLYTSQIEYRIGATDAWESCAILDELTVNSTVLYVCQGEPPNCRTSPEAIKDAASDRYSGRVAKAQETWELFQEADGCGLVLTDDYLLAQYVADHFEVQPTDLCPDYQIDLANLHDGPVQESE